MCFSVTSGSACFRRGSQPDHIKQSGCVGGPGRVGTTRLLCFCWRLPPTLRLLRESDAPAAATSLICFMWFNEDPQTKRGTPDAYEVRGCPTQKLPCKIISRSQSHGGTLVEVGGGCFATSSPVLLMYFCVVCTTIN